MSSGERQTQDEINKIVNDESVQETIIEAVIKEEEHKAKPVKAKPKAKAKPKTKITRKPIEPIKEEEHIK